MTKKMKILGELALAIGMVWNTAFAEVAEKTRTTGQSFALDDKSLPDGRKMTYICVRGSVCDKLIDEIPSRDYSQRGLPIEGAIVWLKRNPRCQGITNASGVFEMIIENGVLTESLDFKDDVVYAWHPGYEVQEFSVFQGGMSDNVRLGVRDSTIRISDYDVTRYFKLKRTSNWEKVCEFDKVSVTLKKGVKRSGKTWVTPEKYSPLQKPLLTPWTLPDGREVV